MKHEIEFRTVVKLFLALAVATLLFPALYGQATDDQKKTNSAPAGQNPTPAGQNPTPAGQNPTPAGQNPTAADENPTPAAQNSNSVSIAVDSGRKTTDLP